MNPPLTEEEIKDYSFWFFDPNMMDDHDWQVFWIEMERKCLLNKGDKVLKKELEDKLYCFRREPISAMVRLGVGDGMDYISMLKTTAENIYAMMEKDWDDDAPFEKQEKKIKLFKSIGSEYFKHCGSDSVSKFYDDFEMELEHHTELNGLVFVDGEIVDAKDFSEKMIESKAEKEKSVINEADEYGDFH